MTLAPHDVRRLSVEALRDPRTVKRAYAGLPVAALAKTAIEAAAARLGLPAPGAATAPSNAKSPPPAKMGSSPQKHEIDHGNRSP